MGGHIERLLGTLMRALQRAADSEASAVLTLEELERWLTDYIVCVYHAKWHSGIGTSPLHRWTAGTFGDERAPGQGEIERPTDEGRIRFDFLPSQKRQTRCRAATIRCRRRHPAASRRRFSSAG
jgi:putative transposase